MGLVLPPVRAGMNVDFVAIRRFRLDDVADLCAAARESIEQIRPWMVWCRADYGMNESLAFVASCDTEWEAGRKYSFAIYDIRDGAFLGSIGLSGVNQVHRFASLGYWVRSSRTRQGVASAAIGLAARFAFEELQLNRLDLIIAVGNHASIKAAEKAGAHCEGILRSRLILCKERCDAWSYSLLSTSSTPQGLLKPAPPDRTATNAPQPRSTV